MPDDTLIPLKPPRTRRKDRAARKDGTRKNGRFSRNGGGDGDGRGPDGGGPNDSGSAGDAPPAPKPKLRKLRLLLVVIPLLFLAIVSTIFGMILSVANELPSLENDAEFRAARNSELLDAHGDPVAKLTGNQNRILIEQDSVSPNIKNAVVAVEDRRFYEHEGVDYKGIARALWQDIRQQSAVQGGSTITQQFVKNALTAQGDRSVFQKMRESALAYHLERKWSKEKILNQYLNTVYFGNGAYGVESAVRTYFGEGKTEFDPDYRAAKSVDIHEAALLAAIIASPTAYDPIQNPKAAKDRRDMVLDRMLGEGMISQREHDEAVVKAIPSEDEIRPPQPDSDQPYFSTWVTQQLVDEYGSGVVFGGGLKITTTLDLEMQAAAEQAIQNRVGWPGGPTASLVAIENKTGEVKAMVGGFDFEKKAFNLATNGHRQPGSAFKPFILALALEEGYGPGSTFASTKKTFPVPGTKGKEVFEVNNYEGQYSGTASLASATAQSDNSVYAELGLKLGTKKVAKMAEEMGIQTEVSTNPAMTLGGLREGVTPLEMAYAYSTIANKGKRVSGTLAPNDRSPVAIEKVEGLDGKIRNKPRTERVFSEEAGNTMHQLLQGVVTGGTGTKASYGGFAAGKTGTTENYGDAWFVGFNERYTVAVWVGYPDKLTYMTSEYHGGPVAGGTFPAEIWRDFMLSEKGIFESRDDGDDDDGEDDELVPAAPVPTAPSAPSDGTESAPDGGGGGQPQREAPQRQPQPDPPRQPAPAPTPAPTPAPPAGGGEGGGAAPGAAE